MSDPLSIAAVSATLRNLLVKGLEDLLPDQKQVTTMPLDKARDETGDTKQVNLFLYQTVPNAALRNMDLPGRVRSGESGHPPLALTLHYLLTAYGENDDDLKGDGHRLLGRAMGLLHDHAVLGREEIRVALPTSDLSRQVERIRVVPQPLSLDEISKLWNAFQTQYRISAAYQVSVVLIDSARSSRTPLPVLSRGSEDQGVMATAQFSPVLTQIRLPRGKPGAELGDELIIRGSNLAGNEGLIRFDHPLLSEPLRLISVPTEIVVEGQSEIALSVKLPTLAENPNTPHDWPIGFYSLLLEVQRPDLPLLTTNALSFALVPTVTMTFPVPQSVPPEVPPGNIQVRLKCVPQLRKEQRVELLFGDRVVQPLDVSFPDVPTQPSRLKFEVHGAVKGTYLVRLRVDGVDSIPVDFSHTPPQFDPELQITVKQS